MNNNHSNHSTISLKKEIQNKKIDFVDGFGNIMYTFDNTKKKYLIKGEKTNGKQIKMIHKNNKKYKNLMNIDKDNYYIGNYNDNKYKNMRAMIFKLTVSSKGFFSEKKKYIFMIIQNPYYNEKSDNISLKGKYKLIIFQLYNYSIYIKYIIEDSIYTELVQ
jgi:hypothetical protein